METKQKQQDHEIEPRFVANLKSRPTLAEAIKKFDETQEGAMAFGKRAQKEMREWDKKIDEQHEALWTQIKQELLAEGLITEKEAAVAIMSYGPTGLDLIITGEKEDRGLDIGEFIASKLRKPKTDVETTQTH